MKIQILYQTQYAYAELVSFSPHLFRLFPKTDRHLRLRGVDFQTNPGAVVNYQRDLFDNEIASCFYPGKSALLQASLNLELEIEERNAFGFLLARHALETPFAYQPAELRALGTYLQAGPGPELGFWQPPAQPQPTVDFLMELNSAIHDHIPYERRDEGEAYSSAELLRIGRGSCRDFSVLLADVLRGQGLAARLASGYLCEFGDTEKVAEGALHAWTEVYIPGAGWLGMDPTNGTFCDHHHITAAVGLTPEDISPVLGNYYNQTHVGAQMTATLQIIPHENF